jgi:uridine phosphorylase
LILVFGRRWRRYLAQKYPGTLDQRTDIYRVRPDVGVTILEGSGAPYAGIAVEEYAALGVSRFVIVGIAGSLQPKVRVGELVLCDRAQRDEGTSHHYLAPGRFAVPSAALTRSLRAALDRSGTPFLTGPTWTIDAPYRETIAEIRRYRALGIATVEMEASAVFAIARCRKRQAAALFAISDNLDERGWEPRFHDTREALRLALRIAIRACEN